ncbi:MAG: hypothetical protein Ct9H90mP16_03340 [Candidatus Poseidoniales archaeon]|nr:MAG: hypothetical protein Ct9H90mP16_03340 [Candidatus Poseidoniales archaeon]
MATKDIPNRPKPNVLAEESLNPNGGEEGTGSSVLVMTSSAAAPTSSSNLHLLAWLFRVIRLT